MNNISYLKVYLVHANFFLTSERWHRFLRHFVKTLTFDEIFGSVFNAETFSLSSLFHQILHSDRGLPLFE